MPPAFVQLVVVVSQVPDPPWTTKSRAVKGPSQNCCAEARGERASKTEERSYQRDGGERFNSHGESVLDNERSVSDCRRISGGFQTDIETPLPNAAQLEFYFQIGEGARQVRFLGQVSKWARLPSEFFPFK